MGADLKILAWITNPINRDGQTLYPMRLAEHMPDARVDFMTWRVDDEVLAEQIKARGAKVWVAPDRLKRPLRYMRAAADIIAREGYDIVHVHGNSHTMALELYAAKRAGIRVRIAHSHNSQGGYPGLHRLLTPIFDRLYTRGYACSKEAGRWMFGGREYVIAPNAIDPKRFAYDENARAALSLEDRFVIGMVGANVPAKNHSFILKTFRMAQQIRPELLLLLIGTGTKEFDGEPSVMAMGAVSDMPRWYSAMDALVMPSLHEGLPTAALEAQCAGLPVLLSENIDEGCAAADNVEFLPLKEDSWREALTKLNRADRERMSADNIMTLKQHGYDMESAARAMYQDYLQEIQR